MATDAPPLHVLIVDDDPAARAVVAAMARYCGYEPVTAADADAALAALAGFGPAVAAAVLDVRMPGADGPASLERLRAAGAAFPVLFLTGSAEPYSDAQLLAWGAVAVLRKPITLDTLRDALDRTAGASKGTAAPDRTVGPPATASAHGSMANRKLESCERK